MVKYADMTEHSKGVIKECARRYYYEKKMDSDFIKRRKEYRKEWRRKQAKRMKLLKEANKKNAEHIDELIKEVDELTELLDM